MSLETARLILKPCDPTHLLVLLEQPERFEQVVGFPVAAGLHEMYVSGAVSPAWVAALRISVGPDHWYHGFFLVHREDRVVIGTGGFKGPSDAAGMVEIAYGVVPSVEGRGYATEAADALIAFALADPRVKLIRAHTLPAANASTRILTKCGFRHTGPVVDPEDGPVWRWERGR